MKDLKDLDDRMVADTMKDKLTGDTVEEEEDMRVPPGPGRHHHEEASEDVEVGGEAEDIIEAERKWNYRIILPRILYS